MQVKPGTELEGFQSILGDTKKWRASIPQQNNQKKPSNVSPQDRVAIDPSPEHVLEQIAQGLSRSINN